MQEMIQDHGPFEEAVGLIETWAYEGLQIAFNLPAQGCVSVKPKIWNSITVIFTVVSN